VTKLLAKLAMFLLPNAAKLWLKADGKKTFSGLIGTALGICLCLFSQTAEYGKDIIVIGVLTTVGGFWHKIVKWNKKRKEEANGTNNV